MGTVWYVGLYVIYETKFFSKLILTALISCFITSYISIASTLRMETGMVALQVFTRSTTEDNERPQFKPGLPSL